MISYVYIVDEAGSGPVICLLDIDSVWIVYIWFNHCISNIQTTKMTKCNFTNTLGFEKKKWLIEFSSRSIEFSSGELTRIYGRNDKCRRLEKQKQMCLLKQLHTQNDVHHKNIEKRIQMSMVSTNRRGEKKETKTAKSVTKETKCMK